MTDYNKEDDELHNGELVIGLACAVGTGSTYISSLLSKELFKYGYKSQMPIRHILLIP